MARWYGGCAAGVVVALLLLGGCSAGGGAEQSLDVADVFASVQATLTDTDEQQRAFSERVADCMREQGFRYEVHVARSPRFDGRGEAVSLAVPEDGSDWLAHAREHGYGYVASQRLLDIDARARELWLERHPDPNERYAESLSPGRRDAYYRTLYGERAADAEANPDHPWPPADPTAGCLGQAVVASNPLVAVPEHVMGELADLQRRVDADGTVAAAQRAWSACMAARGYPAGEVGAFRFEVQREVLDVLQAAGTTGEETATVDVGGDVFEVTVPRWDPAAVQRALAREVEVAAADAVCDRESGYGAARAAARTRLQEQFVEQHRALLLELTSGA